MDTDRVAKLLERLSRALHEDEHSPEYNEVMHLYNKAEDIAAEVEEIARGKPLREKIDAGKMKTLVQAKYDEIDGVMLKLRDVADIFLKVMANTEEVVQRNLEGKSSVEPQRIKTSMEDYRKFIAQQITLYTSQNKGSEA